MVFSFVGLQMTWVLLVLMMLVLWWLVLRGIRIDPSQADSPVSRWTWGLFLAIGTLAAISAGSAWGTGVAADGAARLQERMANDDKEAGVPPGARLFLEYVRFAIPNAPGETVAPGTATVGYSPDSALQLPSTYALPEAIERRAILVVETVGKDGLKVSRHPDAISQVITIRLPRKAFDPRFPDAQLEQAWRMATERGGTRCRKDMPVDGAPDQARDSAYVFLCSPSPDASGSAALKAVLLLEKDPPQIGTASEGVWVRVRPWVFRNGAPDQHHVGVTKGRLYGIGTVEAVVPGLEVWEVPSPPRTQNFVFPPDNPLGECEEWLKGNPSTGAGFLTPMLPTGFITAPAAEISQGTSVCPPWVSPPFVFQVRRLLPSMDTLASILRTTSLLLLVPLGFLLAWFTFAPLLARTNRNALPLMGLAIATVLLHALLIVRLTWAHRIDMMRTFVPVGRLVFTNELLVLLLAALLAAHGWVLYRKIAGRLHGQRPSGMATLLGGLAAWSLVATGGLYLTHEDLLRHRHDFRLLPTLFGAMLSLGLPILGMHWPRIWATLSGEALPADSRLKRWGLHGVVCAGLAGLGILMVAMRTVGHSSAAVPATLKLLSAWLLPLLVYLIWRRPVRNALDTGDQSRWEVITLAVAVLVLGGALIYVDLGVSGVFLGFGLLTALVLRLFDHAFRPAVVHGNSGLTYGYQWFVLSIATGAFFSLAWLTAIAWNHSDGKAAMPTVVTGTFPVMTALFLAFAGVGALWFSSPRLEGTVRKPMRVWAALVLSFSLGIVIFRFMGPQTDRMIGAIMKADATYSHRVAATLRPAHLLLFNEIAFEKTVGAWSATTQENIWTDAESTTDEDDRSASRSPEQSGVVKNGLGYFGAQVVNPGIAYSIDNDYFPVMLVREIGSMGLLRLSTILILMALAVGTVGAGRFRVGSAGSRGRRLLAVLLVMLVIYQPLASLGVLPLTGISWPGLGIDSPGDFWPIVLVLLLGLVWCEANEDDLLPARAMRGYRHSVVVSLSGVTAATLLLLTTLASAANFAAQREAPFNPRIRYWNKPFDHLDDVFAFALSSQCARDQWTGPSDAPMLEEPLLPADQPDALLQVFRETYLKDWNEGHEAVSDAIRKYLDPTRRSCATGRLSPGSRWRSRSTLGEDGEPACEFRFKRGWPEMVVSFQHRKDGSYDATCRFDHSERQLLSLGFEPLHPLRNARIRVVARAMGDARRDVAEIIGSNFVARLRPGSAHDIDLRTEPIGFHVGKRVALGSGLEVFTESVADGPPASFVRWNPPKDKGQGGNVWLIQHSVQPQAVTRIYEPIDHRWAFEQMEPARPVRLDRLTLLLPYVGGVQQAWLFRPASKWEGDEEPAIDALLADDVTTLIGGRKRRYTYGGMIPELGWSSPYNALGLDGWIKRAVMAYTAPRADKETVEGESETPVSSGSRWLESERRAFQEKFCGTLTPPVPTPTMETDPYRALEPVCSRSPLDGVLECRVTLQPELQVPFRHLLELLAQDPRLVGPLGNSRPAIQASAALIRGDTGEIVAQHSFVTGRETTALAPRTPILEEYLIRALEERAIESGAEKAQWTEPIALGSTLKPLIARAVERTDAAFAHDLVVQTGPLVTRPECEFGFLLGHCVPAAGTWKHLLPKAGLNAFLAQSLNWYQATLGLLMLGLGGEGRMGLQPGVPLPSDAWTRSPVRINLPPDQSRFWAIQGTHSVLERSVLNLPAVRMAPAWVELENLIGRPLCEMPAKEDCLNESWFKDICATRSLPIRNPSGVLRHLVALGHGNFDFSDDSMRLHSEEPLQSLS